MMIESITTPMFPSIALGESDQRENVKAQGEWKATRLLDVTRHHSGQLEAHQR